MEHGMQAREEEKRERSRLIFCGSRSRPFFAAAMMTAPVDADAMRSGKKTKTKRGKEARLVKNEREGGEMEDRGFASRREDEGVEGVMCGFMGRRGLRSAR
jgi:hypothetical protein